ncbi:MAG TPA: hypothetical protein VGH28_13830 [Polyangiaceae bacterium]
MPLSAFSDAWKARPKAPVCAGFRALSAADVREIRNMASEEAWKLHERPLDEANRIDAFNDALMRLAVARSSCDPNDVERPWSVLGVARDDNVAIALSEGGVKMLYDEVERASVLASPTRADATNADVLELFDLLETTLDKMTPERAARVRRWLGFCLDEIRAFAVNEEPDGG